MSTEKLDPDATGSDRSKSAVGEALLLTAEQVGQLLGCSWRTVYRLRDAGRIPPPVKLNGMVRWSRKEVEAWIDEGCPSHRRPVKR